MVVVGAVAAIVCGLIAIGRGDFPERIGDWGSVVPGSTGLALPLVALNALTLLAFPVVACIFAGDSIAGEAGWGSLRYLVARPTPRWRILGAKAFVGAVLTVVTILTAVALALIISTAIYGWKPLTVIDLEHSTAFSLDIASFSPAAAFGQTLLAVGVILISTIAVFSFTLLLSTVTEHSFAAVAGGIGMVFTSRALDNIPGLRSLSPWLPVTDSGTTAWAGLFDRTTQTGPISHLIIVQAAYGAALLSIATAKFVRGDILS